MTKKALAGDDSAAVTLSLHYAAIGNVEASRKWLELAANRGDCNAISSLIWDLEIDNARSDVISKWQQRYKSLRCHPKIQYRYRE